MRAHHVQRCRRRGGCSGGGRDGQVTGVARARARGINRGVTAAATPEVAKSSNARAHLHPPPLKGNDGLNSAPSLLPLANRAKQQLVRAQVRVIARIACSPPVQ